MSLSEFDDNCPGCRPAIIDVKTKKILPDDDPVMVAMMKIWGETSIYERRAYHRVMCLNSRDAIDLFIVNGVVSKLKGETEKR
jgi:hypothetical protein